MSRAPVLVALAVAAALALTGCGSGDTSTPADPGQSGVVTPTSDAVPAEAALPETDGKISGAGDLCRVVNADVARRALGHSGDLETETTEISKPVREGIVGCTYRGTVDGEFAAILLTVQAYDEVLWGYGLKSAELRGGKTSSQPGADEVVVWDKDGRTVQARVGGYQAQAINGTNGRFSEDALARLSTVAAKASN